MDGAVPRHATLRFGVRRNEEAFKSQGSAAVPVIVITGHGDITMALFDKPSATRNEMVRVLNSEPGVMRYELSNGEWNAFRAMLPNKPSGVAGVDHRRVCMSPTVFSEGKHACS